MTTRTTLPSSAAGKLFFVSGLSGGRELFLGRARGEVHEGRLTLEGKELSLTPERRLVVRPFTTMSTFLLDDPDHPVQHLSQEEAQEEARGLLELSATHVSELTYPFMCRWAEASLSPWSESAGGDDGLRGPAAVTDPFQGLFVRFQVSAEDFRRTLYLVRHVESTRELDRLAELEGDLLIELGKITNQTALELGTLLAAEPALDRYLAALPENAAGAAGRYLGRTTVRSAPSRVLPTMGGWPFVHGRLVAALGWARHKAMTSLVRELHAIQRDQVSRLNEVLLDHLAALDTLVTEAFGQYGIPEEPVRPGGQGAHQSGQEPSSREGQASMTPVLGPPGTILPAGVGI